MKIEKRETPIKTAFFKHFDARFDIHDFFIQHNQDVRKSGWPDTIIHGFGCATSWEFKHATPNFSSPGIQEVTCGRIARHSFCRYVLFFETAKRQNILIARPRNVIGRKGKTNDIVAETVLDGFDFDALASFIYDVHTAGQHEYFR
jgi:hypothetical protein